MVHIDLNKKVKKYFNTVNWEKTKFELDFVYIQYVMDREAWRAVVHGGAESQTRLSNKNNKASITVREKFLLLMSCSVYGVMLG